MNKKTDNRLGIPFNDYFAEECRKDPGLKERVEQLGEELHMQEMLHLARTEAGLTQEQVAERMHTNRSFVSRLETRPQNMKLSTLKSYSEAVGRKLKLELA
jgi:HTH-type transcriptional regulator / antitoxin HipB